MMENQIFISYSHSDKSYVDEFISLFPRKDIKVWRDINNVEIGDTLIEQIDRGIFDSHFYLIFWSQRYERSEFTKAELSAILHHKIANNNRRIIPIVLDGTLMPPLMSSLLHVKWNSADDVVNKIVKLVSKINDSQVEQISAGESRVELDNLNQYYLEAIANSIVIGIVNLRNVQSQVVILDVAISPALTYRLKMSASLIMNDAIIIDLRYSVENFRLLTRLVNGYIQQILIDGLGVFQTPMKIHLEDKQIELSKTINKIRVLLGEIIHEIAIL